MRLGLGRNNSKKFFAFGGLQALILIFYSTQFYLDWPLLKMSRIRGQFNFEDFITIFTSANCFREIGLQIYIPDPSRPLCFYPYGRTFIYFIDLFRIPAALAPTIVILIGALILFLTINFLGKTSFTEKSLITLVLISPPLWLAIERGNADILICLLVLLAAYSSYKKQNLTSLILLALATLIKFYTLPLLMMEIWRQREVVNKYTYASLVAAVCFVIFVDIQAQHLQQPGSFAFGSPVVTFWLNAVSSNFHLPIREFSIREGQVIGIIILGAIVAFLSRILVASSTERNRLDRSLSNISFFFLGSVYVTCFVLGMSYDYRLIFSALAGIFFMRSYKTLVSKQRWILVVWLLSLWLSVFNFGFSPKIHLLIQWIGNLFDFFTAGLIISIFTSHLNIRVFRGKTYWSNRNE
jgi:hypothetical protein